MTKKQFKITPLIMVGGSGQRLWPLSRKSYPKQFNKLLTGISLFQETILRFKENKILKFNDPLILTNEDYRFIVREQIEEIKVKIDKIIVEPEKKNTAPAILAASIIKKESKDLLLLVPSDHSINDIEIFLQDLKYAVECYERDKLVIFGIKPTRAETGYGYIKINSENNFEKFVEKPKIDEAKFYFQSKQYLWNSGLLMFNSKDLISEFKLHNFQLFENVNKAVEVGKNDLFFFRLNKNYWSNCINTSIDYAILEKTNNVLVLRSNFSWNDLGDWKSVWEVRQKDSNGLVESDSVYTLKSKNSLLLSHDKNQVIGAVGIENLVVVSTRDAILVANKDASQDVKKIVETLILDKKLQGKNHRIDYRPWGNFESLINEKNFQVKTITVLPGESLSLQKHKYRSENWVVVKGIAKVTLDKQVKELKVGESIFIPKQAIHRLENEQHENLIIIEVQTGEYLGEDDIIRIEDKYSR